MVLSRRIDVQRPARACGWPYGERTGAPSCTTQVVADRGVDLTDPALAVRVAAELADLREQTGMRTGGLPRLDSNQRPSD